VRGTAIAAGGRSRRDRAILRLGSAIGLAAAIAVGGGGCEHGITLRGQVSVPVEVQQQFSKDAPGILVMGGGFGGGTISAQLLAVLCEPQPQELSVPFSQSQNGCAAEGTAWFKLTRLAPADRAGLSCGIRQENFDALINTHRITVPDSFDKDKVVADASVTIFKGQGGSCSNGDETVAATLKLAK
jgi:hypothetical protein